MQTATTPPLNPRLWAGGIDQYLADNDITCASAAPIDAGTSCYIWRLDSLSHPGHTPTEPAVLKCADSTPKFSNDAVSPARLSTEVRALTCRAVAEASRAEPSVRVPRVLRVTENGFIMSWAGEVNLLDAFRSDPKLDVADIGARIGKWLGCLQVAGVDSGAPGFEPVNPELGRFYNPGGFMDKLVQSVVTDGKESDRILAALRGTETVRTLTAWDFRPMNALLRFSGGSNNNNNNNNRPDIYIVDWELAQFGEAAGDVGMWCVEAMVLEGKHGGDRGLLRSFLQAYKQHAAGIVDETFVCKLAMVVGVMLVYFMRIAPRLWGSTEEEVGSWRGLAVEFLRAGAERDLGWLRESLIGIVM
ncbi:hypothetical protein CGRA01v4_12234 [Colletotrichum graminicola]|uniref:Aminoglycoside phosphotransferase domain-containing protein n=1 Tax=Colletotrichum graminicola (strain M1.001 / M2 / FGSC 10212) TaxID=645133 RepID=E3R052_COLGM|nr:uncharacterized protein GLRG_11635 [Colletotrichum graminicola M1.001]EFQ36490.1 hypothetical protein GLRG_11635 [Colletotrichum graminicola M1.001]WDK20945.1 hypothetical protein CGRA01v4_12234 [Colletotrichum graminicola]